MRPLLLAISGLVLTLATTLTGCDDGSTSSSTQQSPTAATTTASPSAPPTATPVPAPKIHACYRLGYDQAVSPVTRRAPVPCAQPHTSVTYFVGRLPTVASGHLLAVDSDRVQSAVGDACTRRFAGFVGGTLAERRLSLLRPVWFTPTLAESDRGANWFRCDVVALAGSGRLAALEAAPAGAVDRVPAAYGLCGTSKPGTDGFTRVLCRDPHTWRAVSAVDLAGLGNGRRYPGQDAATQRADGPCQAAGRSVADDPLDYEWGSEVPTREQWAAGRRWATCWAPD